MNRSLNDLKEDLAKACNHNWNMVTKSDIPKSLVLEIDKYLFENGVDFGTFYDKGDFCVSCGEWLPDGFDGSTCADCREVWFGDG